HIKKAEIRQMKQEGFESVEEFSQTIAERHSWSEDDWERALQLLKEGKSLKPGMIHIGSMIGSEHYCVAVCPTAGVESLYHYVKAAAGAKTAITIYCDGQPSVVRGNDSTTYTIGVSKLTLGQTVCQTHVTFDGTTAHCSCRGSSITELIAARCGTTTEDLLKPLKHHQSQKKKAQP
ncbi:hypothetical protein FOZ63_019670, partial [Perkinsus olseni]